MNHKFFSRNFVLVVLSDELVKEDLRNSSIVSMLSNKSRVDRKKTVLSPRGMRTSVAPREISTTAEQTYFPGIDANFFLLSLEFNREPYKSKVL